MTGYLANEERDLTRDEEKLSRRQFKTYLRHLRHLRPRNAVLCFVLCCPMIYFLSSCINRKHHLADFSNVNDKVGKLHFFNVRAESDSNVMEPLPSVNYPSGGPVIISLVTSLTKDLKDLETALRSLDFIHDEDIDHPTPVLIFNEGDLNQSKMQSIIKSTRRPIAFPRVSHTFSKFPPGFDPVDEIGINLEKGRKRWGHQQMVRFYVTDVWKHHALKDFETVMRIDSDSCFKSENKYLPNFAHEHVLYHSGYAGYELEGLKGVQGLFIFVHEYFAANNIVPKNPLLWQFISDVWYSKNSLPGFNSHFEIIRKSFMQRQDVSKFHESLTEKKPFGVFHYRWTLPVIRLLTVALFAKDEMVMKSPPEGYYHRSHCDREAVENALAAYLSMSRGGRLKQ